MNKVFEKVGIVIIGRNEGERLKRCLRSVYGKAKNIVYVDSGSTDGSVDFARSLGVAVVELDMTQPFTMARGRNAGFEWLMENYPQTEWVQFVDGDCEMVDGYLDAAVHTMLARPDITVVTGRRKERYPEASIYNRLCNMEWGREIGEIESCGGDMMVRTEAFKSVRMFNPGMIAGEEPELCVRLRKIGGKIYRIDQDMTIHDADMQKFSQWWTRAIRGGHAYAEGAALQGQSPERHKVRQVYSAVFWSGIIPIMTIFSAIGSLVFPGLIIVLFALLLSYLLLIVKIINYMQKKGVNKSEATLYSVFCAIGKFPNLIGIIRYWMHRLRGRKSTLIEYKPTVAS